MGLFDFLGKVAGIAAPFIPGVGGAVAAGISGLAGASSANKKAKKYQGQIDEATQAQLAMAQKYYPAIFQAMLAQQGFAMGPDGQLVRDNNRALGDQYGLMAQAEANNPFSAIANSSRLGAYAEDTDKSYDAAVAGFNEDLADRGINPASSGAIARMGGIRQAQGQDLAGFRRGLGVRGQEWLADARQGAEQQTYLRSQQDYSRLADMASLLTGQQGQAMGTLGGLQGLYQSKSDAFGANLSGVFGQLAQAGVFGGNKRGSSAGNGRQSTNQAPAPLAGAGLSNPYSSIATKYQLDPYKLRR